MEQTEQGERKGDEVEDSSKGQGERNLLAIVKTLGYILRVMGRLSTSGNLEARKGFLEEMSLELIKD